MNSKDIETKSVDELMQEFGSGDKDAFFWKILSCDSILELSDKEKSAYISKYRGRSYQDTAKALGMNYNSVRTLQFLLKKKVQAAKLTLLLWNMLTPEDEQNGGKGKSKKTEIPAPDERLPGLDKDGKAFGFFTKEQVHDPHNPIYHGSTITLVAQCGADGIYRFLVCTKSSKLLTISDNPDALMGRSYLDVLGGQVEQDDGVVLGQPISDLAYHNCAVRETLLEELNIKSSEPLKFKAENLVYLYTDEADRELFPGLRNIEKSQVFVAKIPEQITTKNILVKDSWRDSLGILYKKRFPSQFLSWEELCDLKDGKDNVFLMDAAQRVVERLSEDEQLKNKLFKILESIEPIY